MLHDVNVLLLVGIREVLHRVVEQSTKLYGAVVLLLRPPTAALLRSTCLALWRGIGRLRGSSGGVVYCALLPFVETRFPVRHRDARATRLGCVGIGCHYFALQLVVVEVVLLLRVRLSLGLAASLLR